MFYGFLKYLIFINYTFEITLNVYEPSIIIRILGRIKLIDKTSNETIHFSEKIFWKKIQKICS